MGAWWDTLSGRRRRRLRDIERQLAQLDAWYDSGGSSTARGSRLSRRRRADGRWGDRLQVLVVLLIMAAVVVAVVPSSRPWFELTRLLGARSGPSVPGGPPAAPTGEGGYAFIRPQPADPARPVTYDPCLVLHVAVNHQGAPPRADEMVGEAVDAVRRATGLSIVVDPGDTDRPLDGGWDDGSVQLGGSRPRAVLVGWAAPSELPALAGDVAGLGGSVARLGTAGADDYFTTGQVALDGPAAAELSQRPGGYELNRAILMHELGHVVGLGHVDDPAQLMSPTNTGRTDWGAGDLRGLAQVGGGRCQSGSRTQPFDPGPG